MAARSLPLLPISLPPTGHGRTLFLASAFLGLCALGQFAALAWYLIGGGVHRHGGRAAARAAAEQAIAVAPPVPTRELAPLALPQPTPLSAAAAAATPATMPAAIPAAEDPGTDAPPGTVPVFTRPTPAPPVARNATGGSVAEFIEQAKVLRTRGDTQSALARLREAQNATGSGADNPLVIAEMALTYEAMRMTDRANAQWSRLLEFGESIGAPYYLAESRLRANGMPPSPVIGGGGALDASLEEGGDPAGTGRDRGGFQTHALLRILKSAVEEEPDPEAERKHALRIVVKNRPGTAIDARKVRVEAQFYDLVDGREIAQTDAETGFRWLSSPVDWSNDSSEELETTYLRPKNALAAGGASSSALLPPPPPAAPRGRNGGANNNRSRRPPAPTPPPLTVNPEPTRVYLGYVVRLYYNRQLQDVRAEPEDLLQRFPPVLTLPAEQP